MRSSAGAHWGDQLHRGLARKLAQQGGLEGCILHHSAHRLAARVVGIEPDVPIAAPVPHLPQNLCQALCMARFCDRKQQQRLGCTCMLLKWAA